jgi:hypothetical protein
MTLRNEQIVRTDLHKNTLIEIGESYQTFMPSYPPAAHLVSVWFAR